ncbi:hypothetical protein LguiA_004899 [Lonicera macranthoides]
MALICSSLTSPLPSPSHSYSKSAPIPSTSSSSPSYYASPSAFGRSFLVPLVVNFNRKTNSIVRRRRESQVVRMAPDEERLTRRNPLDFPVEWERPRPGRRPDIFPKFSPMKTPLPPPMPFDPPEEDDEEEEKQEEEEKEEEDPDEEEPEKPET